jgi:hypothetical protein
VGEAPVERRLAGRLDLPTLEPLMHGWQERSQEAELRRLSKVKHSTAPPAVPLGPAMIDFFQQSVQKRQTRFSQVAACWQTLVPQLLSEHCALESLSRGTLTVLVDSASHLYELKQLLLAGLQDQLLVACKFAGLKKIALRPGRWYEGQDQRERKPRFQ